MPIGLASAAVITAAAAATHGAGVSFEVDGEMIPLTGFAQLTFVGVVIGGLLLGALRPLERWRDRKMPATSPVRGDTT